MSASALSKLSHTKHTYETAHFWWSYTDCLLLWGNISTKKLSVTLEHCCLESSCDLRIYTHIYLLKNHLHLKTRSVSHLHFQFKSERLLPDMSETLLIFMLNTSLRLLKLHTIEGIPCTCVICKRERWCYDYVFLHFGQSTFALRNLMGKYRDSRKSFIVSFWIKRGRITGCQARYCVSV